MFYSDLFTKTFRSPNAAGDDIKHTAKPYPAKANHVFSATTTLTMVLGPNKMKIKRISESEPQLRAYKQKQIICFHFVATSSHEITVPIQTNKNNIRPGYTQV